MFLAGSLCPVAVAVLARLDVCRGRVVTGEGSLPCARSAVSERANLGRTVRSTGLGSNDHRHGPLSACTDAAAMLVDFLVHC